MGSPRDAERDWFTIFRTDEGNTWLYEELASGRLRQGWGAPGLDLRGTNGAVVDKRDWEAAYGELADWGEASPMRFAILSRMLELDDGDIVVMPKMPAWDRFTVARVSGRYRFEIGSGMRDFGHVVPVYPESVRTFAHRANEHAFLVSALFARANHRSAVSFCIGAEQVAAARRLLEIPGSVAEKPQESLVAAAVDDAFRAAAESFAKTVEGWNGTVFENAVRQRFIDQGYDVKETYRRYDGEGSDMDMVVSPPPSRHGPFLPAEIAVQVKWKQGIDLGDAWAVTQIERWADWQGSAATKYVISSATGFTEAAREEAAANGVELIGDCRRCVSCLGWRTATGRTGRSRRNRQEIARKSCATRLGGRAVTTAAARRT